MRAWGCMVLLCAGLADARAAESLGQVLGDVIQCAGSPLEIVGVLDARVGEDGPEAKIVATGEDIAYRIDVTLAQPIVIAGATSTRATWQVDSDEGFGGVVFARFSGDADAVIRHLQLAPAAPDASLSGKFQRALDQDVPCPPTILLTPLDGGQFLLGCGWCNG